MLKEVSKVLSQVDKEDLNNFSKILLKSKTNRIWLIGNGGSSCTASHFASDLDSLGFDVKCLANNIPRLTAIINDFSWSEAYSKQLQHIKKGDILITISVHGGSPYWSNNLLVATMFAQRKGATTLSLLGNDGGTLLKISTFSIVVHSNSTPIIEGIHSILTHLICEKLREKLCNT